MTTIALPDKDASSNAEDATWDDVNRLLTGYEGHWRRRWRDTISSSEPYASQQEYWLDSLQLASTYVESEGDSHDTRTRRHSIFYAISYITYRRQPQPWGSDLERDHYVFVTENGQKRPNDLLELILAYEDRITALKRYGVGDGVSLNDASVEDFWHFVGYPGTRRKAGLVLLDNGNLRASWRDKDGNFLGIQFAGHGQVEYVIFKRRPNSDLVSRVAGVDTLGGIRKQFQAFDLVSLVNS